MVTLSTWLSSLHGLEQKFTLKVARWRRVGGLRQTPKGVRGGRGVGWNPGRVSSDSAVLFLIYFSGRVTNSNQINGGKTGLQPSNCFRDR